MSTTRTIMDVFSGWVFADLLLVMCAFLLPWWLLLLFASLLFFVFDRFVEMLLVALLFDLLYGSSLPFFFDSKFALSIGAVLLYVLFTLIKHRMRF